MWYRSPTIYIKLTRNSVTITHLETGDTAQRSAITPFSSERNIVGSFRYAQETIQAVLLDLQLTKKWFKPSFTVLIQQLEGTEGGLSDIEVRALRDLGEQAGGLKVFVMGDDKALTNDAAMQYVQTQKR